MLSYFAKYKCDCNLAGNIAMHFSSDITELDITQRHVLSICVQQLVSYFVDAVKSDNKFRDCGAVCPLIMYSGNTVLELDTSGAFWSLCVFSFQPFAC